MRAEIKARHEYRTEFYLEDNADYYNLLFYGVLGDPDEPCNEYNNWVMSMERIEDYA